ncbi:MAG TPA: PilN domain-containing protein [Rhodocyclaceae bacterium]
MQRLWLDYQRPDPERRRPGRLLLGAGALAVVLTAGDYLAVAGERDDLRTEVDGLRRAAEHRRLATAAAASAPREATLMAPSAARWETLFSSLEAASGDAVTLLSLHPGEKEIQLAGEAKDFPSAMDYVQRLERQPAFSGVRLTQSEVVAENPNHPVRFALVADWRNPR